MVRRRWGNRSRHAAGRLLGLVALCAGLAGPPTAATAEEVPRAVVLEHAPELHFHPEEEAFPYSPGAFIEHSSLSWSGCRLGKELQRRGTVDPTRLGSGGDPYRSPWISSRGVLVTRLLFCHDEGGDGRSRFSATDFTRPWAKSRAFPLGGGHGFALDVDDARRPGYAGHPASAPVLYQSGTTRSGAYFVTYWFFYAYNNFRWIGPNQRHEGDWEQLVVLLGRDMSLRRVAFSAHGGFKVWSDDEVSLAGGTHPHAYVARGSHAMYRQPGNYDVFGPPKDLARAGGQTWSTWTAPHRFAVVEGRPWWGYGGAWGETSRLGAEFSGPVGPGTWKARYPAEWDLQRGE